MLTAELLASLPPNKRTAFLKSLSKSEFDAFQHSWKRWARPNQLPPPGDWRTWLLLAGRGFGKTRSGPEAVRAGVKAGKRRIALVAPTAADARDVMIEGESGLLSIGLPSERPRYKPSKRRLTWANGAIATAYSPMSQSACAARSMTWHGVTSSVRGVIRKPGTCLCSG
jgi:phage terminase large subunit-like protein